MKLRTIGIASAALLAGACGSSKKSYTPAHDVAYTGPTGAVSATTTAQVASTASGAYTSIGQVTSVGDFTVGAFTSVAGVGAAPTLTVLDAARAAAAAAPKLTSAASVAGASSSESADCNVSGKISGTATLQDPNYPFRYTGDTATITFERCSNGTGEVLDGVISMTINASNGVDFLNGPLSALSPAPYTYAATIAFADLTYANANGMWFGMEGNITLSVTKRTTPTPSYQIEHSISGTGLAYVVGQGSSILAGALLTGPSGSDQYVEKVVTEYSDSSFYSERDDLSTLNGKVCSIAMGGCVQVVTVTPVEKWVFESNPCHGELVITSGKAEIIFDILSVTSVDIGYDFDTTVDPTPLATIHANWTCLEANNCPTN